MSEHIIATSDGFSGDRKLYDALRANKEWAKRYTELEAENAELKRRIADLKDRLRAALMKPQWDRRQR